MHPQILVALVLLLPFEVFAARGDTGKQSQSVIVQGDASVHVNVMHVMPNGRSFRLPPSDIANKAVKEDMVGADKKSTRLVAEMRNVGSSLVAEVQISASQSNITPHSEEPQEADSKETDVLAAELDQAEQDMQQTVNTSEHQDRDEPLPQSIPSREELLEFKVIDVDEPQLDEEDLKSLDAENIRVADFTVDDDASVRLAKQQVDDAELNLDVIRRFPHMSLWEAQLHTAVDEAGGHGARCGDLRDTAFRGYGCAVAERGEPLCLCRGGREDCVAHDSEDVLEYLWMVKANRTVDENIMRELLAGRCDYAGGHQISSSQVAAASAVLLIPILFSSALCCCPVLLGAVIWGQKRSEAAKAKAVLIASQVHRGSGHRHAVRHISGSTRRGSAVGNAATFASMESGKPSNSEVVSPAGVLHRQSLAAPRHSVQASSECEIGRSGNL